MPVLAVGYINRQIIAELVLPPDRLFIGVCLSQIACDLLTR